MPARFSAEHGDLAAVRLDQLARYGEPEARAFHAAHGADDGGLRPAAAEEQVEDRLALLLRHAGPGIQNLNDGFSCDRARIGRTASAAGKAQLRFNAEAVDERIEARNAARKAKNFAEADRIRGELEAMGVTLKDAKDPKTGELVTTWEVAR